MRLPNERPPGDASIYDTTSSPTPTPTASRGKHKVFWQRRPMAEKPSPTTMWLTASEASAQCDDPPVVSHTPPATPHAPPKGGRAISRSLSVTRRRHSALLRKREAAVAAENVLGRPLREFDEADAAAFALAVACSVHFVCLVS